MPCAYVARADMTPLAAVRHHGCLWRGHLPQPFEFGERECSRGAGRHAAQGADPGGGVSGGDQQRWKHGAAVSRAAFLHPATASGAPITAAALRYVCAEGTAEREVCFYGDHELMSHLWKVLSLPKFAACIRFGEPHVYGDPRNAAERTHAEVVEMRAERVPELVPSGS